MSGLIPSDNSVYSPEFTASAMIVYTTGEGMVVELTHLGRVWTQSRNPNDETTNDRSELGGGTYARRCGHYGMLVDEYCA